MSTTSYPGVYIKEVRSDVRTITAATTSVAAFVGRAKWGPIDTPLKVNSYADFERKFGGLWEKSPMTYAVRDFYLNGGSQAIIVRLYKSSTPGEQGKATLTLDSVTFEALNPGAWGNNLQVKVNHDALDATSGFSLTVMLKSSTDEVIKVEKFLNVSSTSDSPRYFERVLKNESTLITASSSDDTRPSETEDFESLTSGNDGQVLSLSSFETGLYALDKGDPFNLLCIPPHDFDVEIESSLMSKAAEYCAKRRALFIVDPRKDWTTKDEAKGGIKNDFNGIANKKNAAVFFPLLKQPNPLKDYQVESFAPCGAVAGVMARTDGERGVWKAPAGTDARLNGVPELSIPLTDEDNGDLNPLGLNCLRNIPGGGNVIWGARTLDGDDRLASEWKYIPVRRTALFIEESLYRGTQWVVFEPNDEPLWAQIRLNVGVFMQDLFRQGAFQGKTPKEAYFVKCDSESTTQSDINLGVVNIIVGFAPLKPAEFVIIKLQQMAGQLQT